MHIPTLRLRSQRRYAFIKLTVKNIQLATQFHCCTDLILLKAYHKFTNIVIRARVEFEKAFVIQP